LAYRLKHHPDLYWREGKEQEGIESKELRNEEKWKWKKIEHPCPKGAPF
jgi:hypothetical protein